MAFRAPSSELRAHYKRLADVWDKLAQERLMFFVSERPVLRLNRAAVRNPFTACPDSSAGD